MHHRSPHHSIATHVPSGRQPPRNLFSDDDFATQRAFFAARPELPPTPLRSLSSLAHRLGLAALLVKDETSRFGLNAFKAVGTTFAVATLQQRGLVRRGDTLVCASEGNHGRAVARAAKDAGCAARVYMADSVSPARVEAIKAEGSEVILVPGGYDAAVRQMAADAQGQPWTVVSDTSWGGYEEIPRLIMLGYTRLMDEAADQWGDSPPNVVFVPGGVGGLLAAVACWGEWRYRQHRPLIVAVEPTAAACLQASVRAGQPTPVPVATTALTGLRCGEVSPSTFGAVQTLVDGFIAIDDDLAFEGMRLLARPAGGDEPIACGPSGAAALGGVIATLQSPDAAHLRNRIGLGEHSRVLVLVTEGATDRAVYDSITGDRAP